MANLDNNNNSSRRFSIGQDEAEIAAKVLRTLLNHIEGDRNSNNGGTLSQAPNPHPRLPPVVTNKLAIASIVWQAVNITLLYLVNRTRQDAPDAQKTGIVIGTIIIICLQLLHVIALFIAAIKLSKQVLHRTVSFEFLAQGWFSTVIVFAGLYTLLYYGDPNTFLATNVINLKDPAHEYRVFVAFIYFSVATATTVGYGDITPSLWYTQLIVTLQMIVSFVYTAVIFAKGLHHFHDERFESMREEHASILARSKLWISNHFRRMRSSSATSMQGTALSTALNPDNAV